MFTPKWRKPTPMLIFMILLSEIDCKTLREEIIEYFNLKGILFMFKVDVKSTLAHICKCKSINNILNFA